MESGSLLFISHTLNTKKVQKPDASHGKNPNATTGEAAQNSKPQRAHINEEREEKKGKNRQVDIQGLNVNLLPKVECPQAVFHV